MASNPDVWLTPLNRAEVFHAIYAHVFWQKVTLLQAEKAIANFRRSCENGVWNISEFPAGAFDRSTDLARQFGPTIGIRTIDSLHVGCALELKSRKFWTFDDRQAKLALAVGLDIAP